MLRSSFWSLKSPLRISRTWKVDGATPMYATFLGVAPSAFNTVYSMPPSSVAKRTVGFGGVVKAPQAPHNLTLTGPCATKDPRYSNVTWRGSSGFCQENLQNVKILAAMPSSTGPCKFLRYFWNQQLKERYVTRIYSCSTNWEIFGTLWHPKSAVGSSTGAPPAIYGRPRCFKMLLLGLSFPEALASAWQSAYVEVWGSSEIVESNCQISWISP